jgi:hypothetical protein
MLIPRRTETVFHHFKGVGTLCVVEEEGKTEARFGLALQHQLDQLNRPLGRKISQGRAEAQRGFAGKTSLETLKDAIKYLREVEQNLTRHGGEKSEYEKMELDGMKTVLLQKLGLKRD